MTIRIEDIPQKSSNIHSHPESLQVLIHVSDGCPLHCIYCYKGEKRRGIISEKTIGRLFRLIEDHESSGRVSYTWLGAEPLTAGLAFFKRMRRLQKKICSHEVINYLQTNGVLLSRQMIDFFLGEGFSLSFSVDGPEFLHNKLRPYVSGRGSFERVMRAVDMTRKAGGSTPALTVITRQSAPHIDKIYAFFKHQGMNFRVNTVVNCGTTLKNSENLLLNQKERATVMCRLFDLWFDDKSSRRPEVRPLALIKESFDTHKPAICTMMKSCQTHIFAIGTDGTIYPCARFSDRSVSFGNINSISSLEVAMNHPLRIKLLNRYDFQKKCHRCNYRLQCYSGCMHSAYLSGDIMGISPDCRSDKAILRHVAKRLSTAEGLRN
jgi:uncharacterized protein